MKGDKVMIKMTNTGSEKDNTIVINGMEFMVSDAVALKIKALCENGISAQVGYEVKECKDVVTGSKFYRVCEVKSWHTSAEHKKANELIKAVEGIKKYSFAGKDGKVFPGYGFAKKADAETAVKNLPTIVEA